MHHSLWVKVWMDRATLKTIVQVFKEIVLPTVLPFMPLLGTNPNDCMSYYRYIGMSMFITALFVRARKQNHARCTSVDKWITRIWCQNTTGLPSTTKKMKLGGKDGTGEHYIVRESAILHAAFQLLFKFVFAIRVPFPASCGFDIEIQKHISHYIAELFFFFYWNLLL